MFLSKWSSHTSDVSFYMEGVILAHDVNSYLIIFAC